MRGHRAGAEGGRAAFWWLGVGRGREGGGGRETVLRVKWARNIEGDKKIEGEVGEERAAYKV